MSSTTFSRDTESASDKKDLGQTSMIINRVSVLAIIGWIIYTIGVLGCMFANKISKLSVEPVYHIWYYAFIIVAFFLVAGRPKLASYRLAVMAFLAVGFNYLTFDMEWSIYAYRGEQFLNSDGVEYSPKNFTDVALAGTCILIVAWVAMIITFSRSVPN